VVLPTSLTGKTIVCIQKMHTVSVVLEFTHTLFQEVINVDFLLKRIFIDNLESLNDPGEMKFIYKPSIQCYSLLKK
jgi:hypothetical protein